MQFIIRRAQSYSKYVSLGYVVLSIDGRGSTNRGVAFEKDIYYKMVCKIYSYYFHKGCSDQTIRPDYRARSMVKGLHGPGSEIYKKTYTIFGNYLVLIDLKI